MAHVLAIDKEGSFYHQDLDGNLMISGNYSPSAQFPTFSDCAHNAVDSIDANYNKDVAAATTTDQKLAAMASASRALMVGHSFADANQRAVVNIGLNKMLLQNGMSPVILRDPYADERRTDNRADGGKHQRWASHLSRFFGPPLGVPHF